MTVDASIVCVRVVASLPQPGDTALSRGLMCYKLCKLLMQLHAVSLFDYGT